LAEFAVSATFFLIGEQVLRYPDVAAGIAQAGHEIAIHGWDHRLLPVRSPFAVTGALPRAHHLIRDVTGQTPVWYRPPYGAASGPALLAAHRLGMQPVWWTRWGNDWSTRHSGEDIADRILHGRGARGATISSRDTVLLHDSDAYAMSGSWRGTRDALPRILSGIEALGERVGPLTEASNATRPVRAPARP
jgi:peptidoglycan/xylan/chitin deacetylase (PgdA/CDA1 family)